MDGARENRSNTIKLLAQRYGVKLRFTRPHVSQETFAEREHQTLKNLLRRAVLDLIGRAPDLDAALAAVTLSYNHSLHTTLGMAPWTVFYGRPPPKNLPPVLLTGAVALGQAAGAASGAGALAQLGSSGLVTRAGPGRNLKAEIRRLASTAGSQVTTASDRARRMPSALGGQPVVATAGHEQEQVDEPHVGNRRRPSPPRPV